MSKHVVEVEKKRLKMLEETSGTITYMIRLNPDDIPEAAWRQCTSHEYFTAKENKHFGGLLETKTILNFYNGDSKELDL